MTNFEKLGAFYLGRPYDLDRQESSATQPLLYDTKDLTTHAVCVGMTGSGKTGLGVTLIEEAALDGIPVIAIGPKGDLGNLLLTFPALRADDFRPWIDEADAARHGRAPAEHAQWTADLWREGLKTWGQKPTRIGAFERAAERTIYTPGSQAGVPISVLRSFARPGGFDRHETDRLLSGLTSRVFLMSNAHEVTYSPPPVRRSPPLSPNDSSG